MFLWGGQYENIAAKHWIRGVPLFYFHSSCDLRHTEKFISPPKIISPISQDPDLMLTFYQNILQIIF